MKKVVSIILDVILVAVIILWGYMLYKEFGSFTADTGAIKFSLFNIKVILFGLFVIASVSVLFYINLIIGKSVSNHKKEGSLDDFVVNNDYNKDDVMAHLEVVRKLLITNLDAIENIWDGYIKTSNTETGDDNSEEILLKELSAQTAMIKQQNSLKLLYELADSAASLTDSKRVSLFLYSPENNNLSMVKAIGFKDIKEKIEIELDEGIAAYSFKNAKRIFVTNIETHPELGRKNKEQYKTKSFIIFPLAVFNDNIIGVLNITEKNSENSIYNMLDLEKMNLLMNSFSLKMESLILMGELAKRKSAVPTNKHEE